MTLGPISAQSLCGFARTVTEQTRATEISVRQTDKQHMTFPSMQRTCISHRRGDPSGQLFKVSPCPATLFSLSQCWLLPPSLLAAAAAVAAMTQSLGGQRLPLPLFADN